MVLPVALKYKRKNRNKKWENRIEDVYRELIKKVYDVSLEYPIISLIIVLFRTRRAAILHKKHSFYL